MNRAKAVAQIKLNWWTRELGRQLNNNEDTAEAEQRVRELSRQEAA